MVQPIKHIAIIMDGGRRWAQKRNLKIYQGHLSGVKSVQRAVKFSIKNKISYLTLFAFSTENWRRPQKEVLDISRILEESILKYSSFILSHHIRLHILGDLSPFSKSFQESFSKVCEKSQENSKLNLILAVNYGGRKEIVDAVKKLFLDFSSFKNQNNKIENSSNLKKKRSLQNINEEVFEKYLQSNSFPHPDLIIRTGGVKRLSNFYLWSSAYSELYFSSLLWPDFDEKEMQRAIDYYLSEKRRFGV